MFTALEQQHAFEVRKTHIHQQRLLCQPCWRAQHGVAERLDGFAARWAENKALLRCDGDFLRDWHALLLENERYGGRRNGAKMAMLSKLLDSEAKPR